MPPCVSCRRVCGTGRRRTRSGSRERSGTRWSRPRVEAFPKSEPNDFVLWIESHRAVISGDTLVDFGRGLEIPLEWLREGVTREQIAEGLRPLLELPIEHMLPTHGAPSDRAALKRALS
jgi:hypothetical protein